MSKRFLLERKSKLKSSAIIRELFLFKGGVTSLKGRVIEIRFRRVKEEDDVYQVAFLVGKRLIAKAHQRNYLKRRMREAFRLNQHLIPVGKVLQLLVIYRSRNISTYKEINDEMVELLNELNRRNRVIA